MARTKYQGPPPDDERPDPSLARLGAPVGPPGWKPPMMVIWDELVILDDAWWDRAVSLFGVSGGVS